MTNRRQKALSASIRRAILYDVESERAPLGQRADSLLGRILAALVAFFRVFQLVLARYDPALFARLRGQVWRVDEDVYAESFTGEGAGKEEKLKTAGDLGYSGSTFFTTPNSLYLIKSLPRRHEFSFFEHELLPAYAAHMSAHPSSLLVRITDYLYTPHPALGALLQLTPSRHIIMENVLHSFSSSSSSSGKAENYDLKPTSYFFPERDIAGGTLASEATKSKLADDFDDKVRVGKMAADCLLRELEGDTQLLADANAVDYSLFLVRFPLPDDDGAVAAKGDDRPDWRKGVRTTRVGDDGKRWMYRAVVLDFFWAKHKMTARAMTGLVQTWNVVGRDGPMSITTTAGEYRERFLRMVGDLVEVVEGGE